MKGSVDGKLLEETARAEGLLLNSLSRILRQARTLESKVGKEELDQIWRVIRYHRWGILSQLIWQDSC